MFISDAKSILKKILLWFIGSPVRSVFIVLLLYFAIIVWLFDGLADKLFLVGVFVLWLFWFFAKNMIKVLLFLVILGAAGHAYYQYSHREQIQCEESGGVWNKKTKTCDEKSLIRVWLEKAWQYYKEL